MFCSSGAILISLVDLQFFGTDTPRPPFMMGVTKVVEFLKAAKITTLEIYDSQKQFEESQKLPESDDESRLDSEAEPAGIG